MKNMMKFLLGVMVFFGAAGCSTTNSGFSKPDLSKVSVGMTKQEVIKAMGKPDNIAIQGEREYLEYGWDKAYDGVVGASEWFYVRLINGKVESYGRKGDFGTTRNPGVDININQKVDSASRTEEGNGASDLFTELKKLQMLRDEGAITKEEYEALRRAAVEKAK